MRSTEDWSRLGGGLIIVLAAAAAMVVLVPRLLGVAAGPEAEIITALKTTEREGLSMTLPGVQAPLESQKHYFARITVNVEPGGERAVAWATLDFDGKLGATAISSLGVERVPFVRRGREWVPENLAAPRLAAVVRALESRRRALESGNRQALAGLRAPGLEANMGGGEAELERVLELPAAPLPGRDVVLAARAGRGGGHRDVAVGGGVALPARGREGPAPALADSSRRGILVFVRSHVG
ncbi:hypothetical protein ACN28I_16500 [Archangium gephyra]|uniref:hypothetical protein n=1 Tax=Archangium gephyra TaxID=48 RepID=UPI003B7C6867